MIYRVLSEAKKLSILRWYWRGEKIIAIAARFGVHRSYPTLLAKRRGYPLRRTDIERANMSKSAYARKKASQ